MITSVNVVWYGCVWEIKNYMYSTCTNLCTCIYMYIYTSHVLTLVHKSGGGGGGRRGGGGGGGRMKDYTYNTHTDTCRQTTVMYATTLSMYVRKT